MIHAVERPDLHPPTYAIPASHVERLRDLLSDPDDVLIVHPVPWCEPWRAAPDLLPTPRRYRNVTVSQAHWAHANRFQRRHVCAMLEDYSSWSLDARRAPEVWSLESVAYALRVVLAQRPDVLEGSTIALRPWVLAQLRASPADPRWRSMWRQVHSWLVRRLESRAGSFGDCRTHLAHLMQRGYVTPATLRLAIVAVRMAWREEGLCSAVWAEIQADGADDPRGTQIRSR